jgi:hypothetical protein
VALLIGKTEFVATSQANIVKMALLKARIEGAKELGLEPNKITVDSPVPYKLATFRAAVEADKPPQASKQDSHNSILEKLDVLVRDARVRFLMAEWTGGNQDPFPVIVEQLVGAGPQPRIVDLSGVPNEVAGVSSAVIARTLFNLKVWQNADERSKDPVLLVCEEAHRYVPNRGEAQYEAAQEAVRRIAKEGRKYGRAPRERRTQTQPATAWRAIACWSYQLDASQDRRSLRNAQTNARRREPAFCRFGDGLAPFAAGRFAEGAFHTQ